MSQSKLIYDEKNPLDPIPGSNFGHFLLEKMKENGSKIYQIDPETDEQWTYAKTVDYIIRVALELQSRGIGPGKIVTVLGFHSLPFILPFYASFLVGATVSPISTLFKENEIELVFTFARPDLIICEENSKSKIKKVLQKLKIDVEIVTFEKDLPEFLGEKHESKVVTFKASPVDATNICLILCTSRTTGQLKGVPITHWMFYSQMALVLARPLATETTVILNYSPTSWVITPFLHALASTLGVQKIVANYDPAKHFQWSDKYGVNWILGNANFLSDLIHHPNFSKSNMNKSIKWIHLMGTAPSIHQIDELIANFPNAIIRNGYGSTELCGNGFSFGSKCHDKKIINQKRYSVGFPTQNHICKLIDQETNEIITEPNRPGELYIKGPVVFNGYLNQPELNREIFDDEGFYKTGDIFVFDEDKFFTFVGRVKDVIKYNIYTIYPLEIENVIAKHPSVNKACVIGRPNAINVETPMAFVAKNPGFEKITEDELVKFVEDRVEDHQRLRGGVVFLDEFPTNASGKTIVTELKKLIL